MRGRSKAWQLPLPETRPKAWRLPLPETRPKAWRLPLPETNEPVPNLGWLSRDARRQAETGIRASVARNYTDFRWRQEGSQPGVAQLSPLYLLSPLSNGWEWRGRLSSTGPGRFYAPLAGPCGRWDPAAPAPQIPVTNRYLVGAVCRVVVAGGTARCRRLQPHLQSSHWLGRQPNSTRM